LVTLPVATRFLDTVVFAFQVFGFGDASVWALRQVFRFGDAFQVSGLGGETSISHADSRRRMGPLSGAELPCRGRGAVLLARGVFGVLGVFTGEITIAPDKTA